MHPTLPSNSLMSPESIVSHLSSSIHLSNIMPGGLSLAYQPSIHHVLIALLITLITLIGIIWVKELLWPV